MASMMSPTHTDGRHNVTWELSAFALFSLENQEALPLLRKNYCPLVCSFNALGGTAAKTLVSCSVTLLWQNHDYLPHKKPPQNTPVNFDPPIPPRVNRHPSNAEEPYTHFF